MSYKQKALYLTFIAGVSFLALKIRDLKQEKTNLEEKLEKARDHASNLSQELDKSQSSSQDSGAWSSKVDFVPDGLAKQPVKPSIAQKKPSQPIKEDPFQNSGMDEVYEDVVEEIYGDLFDKLDIDKAKGTQLRAHLLNNQKLQQKLSMDMLDDSKSDQEILAQQAQLRKQHLAKMGQLLNEDQKEVVDEYHDNLSQNLSVKLAEQRLHNLPDSIDEGMKKQLAGYIAEKSREYDTSFGSGGMSGHPFTISKESLPKVRNLMRGDPEALLETSGNQERAMGAVLKRIKDEEWPAEAIESVRKMSETDVQNIRRAAERSSGQIK